MKDLTGRTFESLTVLGFSHKGTDWRSYWVCQCACGKVTTVRGSCLEYGGTKSCGCSRPQNKEGYRRKTPQKKRQTRSTAERKTPTYWSWVSMRKRCKEQKRADYKNYGGRGITVCDRWERYENFLEDMGERPEGKTIDRVDNNKGYSKENCKWSTVAEQALNKRPRTKKQPVAEVRA